jgi:hypothetical protein
MKTVLLVSEQDRGTALNIEKKLLSVSGVLFVGVKVLPTETDPVFQIVIGCEDHPEAIALYSKTALISFVQNGWVRSEDQFQILSYKGKTKITN